MQKTTQSGNSAKKELELQKALVDALEKRIWKMQLENENLQTRVGIFWFTTLVSVIWVLILFFSR